VQLFSINFYTHPTFGGLITNSAEDFNTINHDNNNDYLRCLHSENYLTLS